jgi:hypothetical protein
MTNLSFKDVSYTKINPTDTLSLGVENLSFITRMANDTVFGRLAWDDDLEENHNKALIESYFHPHEKGGIFTVTKADLIIQDSTWTVSPNNFIDFTEGRVTLSNLMFSNHRQSIRADGYVPMNVGDTLSVQLRNFDLSNIDFLTIEKGLNLDGFISGDALVSDLKKNPML